MKVTQVRLVPATGYDPSRGLLAYASVELDGCFVIHDVKLFDREQLAVVRRKEHDPAKSKLFVQMPCVPIVKRCIRCGRKTPIKDRECLHCREPQPYPLPDEHLYHDQCHPTTPECRGMIEGAVIDRWEAMQSPMGHRDEIPEEVFGGGLIDA